MATQLKPRRSQRIRRALDALFREAWLVQRRRRRRQAAFVVLLCAIVAGVAAVLGDDGSPSPGTATGRPDPVGARSRSLPSSGDYFSLGVVGGRLIVSGGPAGSLFPSGSTTTLSHGRASSDCDAATVNPRTLKLTDVARANCADPALYGLKALVVQSQVRGLPSDGGTFTVGVRIARVDQAAPGGFTLGPVVMAYGQCSDCGAEWIYGDGSAWIYDAYARRTRPSGELLRVSEATGAIRRWTMPAIVRPLLAVDRDGLWLSPSNQSGGPPTLHPTAAQNHFYDSLIHIPGGAGDVSRPFDVPVGALWLVAAGHTVWLERLGAPRRSQLWRLDGGSARAHFLGDYPADSSQDGEYGAGPPTYAGDANIGIDYVVNGNATQQVFRLSPNSPRQHRLARVNAPRNVSPYGAEPAVAAFDGSFYFLDPPTLSYPANAVAPAVHGQGVLYRVRVMSPRR